MRPIDADLLKTKIKLKNAYDPTIIQLYESIIKWIDSQPTVEGILSEDAISRKEAIKSIREQFSYGECYCDEYSIVGLMNNLPSVYPKTGYLIRWYETIEHDNYAEHYQHCKCSECDQEYDPYNVSLFNYCPNCGAKIEKEDKNEQKAKEKA